MPPSEGCEPLSKSEANKIMHITLPISKEICLIGSDNDGEGSSKF